VEPEKILLLNAVASAAGDLNIPWLLTGAGGRILLLEKLHGLPPGRATEDLDFGVMVRSWNEYNALKRHICESGQFHEDTKQSQRLWYKDAAKLDLVPFGAIASPDESVQWPKEDGAVMNVLGFQEACDTAISIRVNSRLKVPVATAQAMLLLKLIAWEDRHARLPGKDASDIAYLLYNGEKIIGADAFYEEYSQATEAVGWDLELAAARIFGLQMATITLGRTKEYLLVLLERELARGEESMLVGEVAASLPTRTGDSEQALAFLRQVQAGLVGKAAP
jgi:predicted nucleotidyltransferase